MLDVVVAFCPFFGTTRNLADADQADKALYEVCEAKSTEKGSTLLAQGVSWKQ